ncbi:MAG: kinase [Myxococcaceae bacterium]|nr:kinase [Myxococcaceae bacterium]
MNGETKPVRESRRPRNKDAPRVLVIYKKSAYQLMVRERKNARARALLDRKDRAVERLLASHEDHVSTIAEARVLLDRLGVDATFRYRADADTADAFDLIVTLGGDGTLLWASHLVCRQPMVAVNTAPRDSVGYFCAGTKDNLEEVLVGAIERTLPSSELTRVQITLDGEVVSKRVLNDVLFCHECPAATTRYLLKQRDVEEDHKSSGLWIGPAAGSTAAQRSAGGQVLPSTSTQIQYVVREPYTADGSSYKLVKGLIEADEELLITSKTHGARLYVDGPHLRRKVALGSEIGVKRSPEPLTVLGFRARD